MSLLTVMLTTLVPSFQLATLYALPFNSRLFVITSLLSSSLHASTFPMSFI